MGAPVASGTLAASTSGSLASIHKKPPAEAPVGGSTSRVEHAGGGLGHDGPIPPRAEVRCSWLPAQSETVSVAIRMPVRKPKQGRPRLALVVTSAAGGSPAQIGSGARPAIRCGAGSVTSGMLAVDAERGSGDRSPLLSANGSASAAAVVLVGELPFRASVVSRLARLRSVGSVWCDQSGDGVDDGESSCRAVGGCGRVELWV